MVTVIVGLIGFIIGIVVTLLIYRNNTKKVSEALNAVKQGGDAHDVLKKVYNILK